MKREVRGRTAWLKLDIDAGMPRPTLYDLRRRLYRAGYRIQWLSECRSPGGRGWHLTLCVRPSPRTALEVVALQAILGSDPDREACNCWRARMLRDNEISGFWRERWNVLYRR